jgi:dihydroxyacetone kinase-like predicted kinase
LLQAEAKKLRLQHTPELLPILKEVGVVDSGGAGLCVVIEGMDKAAHGEVVAKVAITRAKKPVFRFAKGPMYAGAKLTEDEEGYGYCTQFILRLGKPGEWQKAFHRKEIPEQFLATHGKSLVMVRDDDIVKVHVHTLNPGQHAQFCSELWRIRDDHDREHVRRASQYRKRPDRDRYECELGSWPS